LDDDFAFGWFWLGRLGVGGCGEEGEREEARCEFWHLGLDVCGDEAACWGGRRWLGLNVSSG